MALNVVPSQFTGPMTTKSSTEGGRMMSSMDYKKKKVREMVKKKMVSGTNKMQYRNKY